MAPWYGFHLLDREKWIWLILHEYEELLLDWLICLLYLLQSVCCSKYFAKTTNFSILNPFLDFLHLFVLKYFRIFVTVPKAIYVSLRSKISQVENFCNKLQRLSFVIRKMVKPNQYFVKTTNFSILNPFLHFLHPFVLKYSRIFATVPNAIYVSLPSKIFHEGNLEEDFINFVAFCLPRLVCWILIVCK